MRLEVLNPSVAVVDMSLKHSRHDHGRVRGRFHVIFAAVKKSNRQGAVFRIVHRQSDSHQPRGAALPMQLKRGSSLAGRVPKEPLESGSSSGFPFWACTVFHTEPISVHYAPLVDCGALSDYDERLMAGSSYRLPATAQADDPSQI
jgi:hypothetical protein